MLFDRQVAGRSSLMKKLPVFTLLLLLSCVLYAQKVFISPDGKKRVEIKQTGGGLYQVTVNSTPHKPYQEIQNNKIYFITDSCAVLYIAQNNSSSCVVIDGIEQSYYNIEQSNTKYKTYNVFLSPDGRHWALSVNLKYRSIILEAFYVIDGKKQPFYNKVGLIQFSPDNKHWFYPAKDKEKSFYDWVSSILTFSPNGKQWSYRAKDKKKYFFVIDYVEQSHYHWVSLHLTYSPDSKRWFYEAQDKNKWFYVIDNMEKPHYDITYTGAFSFSPNYEHWSYLAMNKKKWFYVIDDEEQTYYDRIDKRGFIYSPDSKHWAYDANIKRKWFCIQDNNQRSIVEPDLCSKFNQNETSLPECYTTGMPYIGFGVKSLNGFIEPVGLKGSFDGRLTLDNITVFNAYFGSVWLLSSKYQRQAWELGLGYGKPRTTFNNESGLYGHFALIELRSKRYFFSYSRVQPFILIGCSYTGLFTDSGYATYTGDDGESYDFSTYNTYSFFGIDLGLGLSYSLTPYICLNGSLSHDILLGGGKPLTDMYDGGRAGEDISLRKINFGLGIEFDL
jgi:hypothetical protein